MISLTEAQMPNHNHSLLAGLVPGPAGRANSSDPANNFTGVPVGTAYATGSTVAMASNALSNTGGSQSHNNMQPFIAMNFIIALQGLYPSRG